jgi:hypothetical protein
MGKGIIILIVITWFHTSCSKSNQTFQPTIFLKSVEHNSESFFTKYKLEYSFTYEKIFPDSKSFYVEFAFHSDDKQTPWVYYRDVITLPAYATTHQFSVELPVRVIEEDVAEAIINIIPLKKISNLSDILTKEPGLPFDITKANKLLTATSIW